LKPILPTPRARHALKSRAVPEPAPHHEAVRLGDDPPRSGLEADFADAEREARIQHPEQSSERAEGRDTIGQDDASPHLGERKEADPADAPHTNEDDPQREHAYQLASAESTKRQDVERAARSGEAVPGEAASSALSPLADDLRAAENAVEREHGNDAGNRMPANALARASRSAGAQGRVFSRATDLIEKKERSRPVIDSGVIAQPFRPRIALVMTKLAAGVRLFLRQAAIKAVFDFDNGRRNQRIRLAVCGAHLLEAELAARLEAS